MRRFRYVVADVFTDEPLTGNALAVFTDARDFSEADKQAIARTTYLSETTLRASPRAVLQV